jgi:hypothetical protein
MLLTYPAHSALGPLTSHLKTLPSKVIRRLPIFPIVSQHNIHLSFAGGKFSTNFKTVQAIRQALLPGDTYPFPHTDALYKKSRHIRSAYFWTKINQREKHIYGILQ